MLQFTGARRLPVVLQTEAAECGLACLAMVASYHGHRTDLNALRRQHPVSLNGVTLRGLIQVAGRMHLGCRPLRLEPGHLRQLALPAILHWDMNHFVVLKKVTSRDVVIHDPSGGERRVPMAELARHLTGVALELTPTEGFQSRDDRVRLPFSAFWGQTPDFAHAIAQVFVLSVVLELLVIAGPFYMQITVDEVIARGDVDLLLVLALGFGLLTAISVATTVLRSLVLLILQSTLHFQMGARLFHHLLRLPLAYFEKRHVGDILSRFGSLEPVRDLLSQGLIAAVIDGIMAIATLVMIFIYSPRLAVVILVALFLYATLRLALFRMFRDRNEAAIRARAQENSAFIETVRAVQSIKLFNREGEREGQWLNRYADSVNAGIRLGRATITFRTMNDVIFGAENIIVIYLAARLALAGDLTIGMIFAFMSYKRHFTDKAVSLVEKLLEFRILGLHLERLSDIALTPLERGHDAPLGLGAPLRGGIELRNVSFRYAETDRLILDNVNLRIEPGQFVTISGPSGGGKTTLLKVMLGLIEPTGGEVLVDGIPLATIGPRAFREQVAAVMQEDQLLSGSVADNICFFDADLDQAWMMECARLAGIHDEIMGMPMGYNSLVGDMGSSLSGGQKQRVLLARALYRRPRILFLDEGTSQLDVPREQQINTALRGLSITRISVAHRPGMTEGADVVFRLDPAG